MKDKTISKLVSMCATDLDTFARFFKISCGDDEQLYKPYRNQTKMMNAIQETVNTSHKNWCTIQAPRASGKSTVIAISALWAIMFGNEDSQVLVITANMSQANLISAQIIRLYNSLPKWLRDNCKLYRHDRNRFMFNENGTAAITITNAYAYCSSSENVTFDAVFADDADFLTEAKQFNFNIMKHLIIVNASESDDETYIEISVTESD